MHYASPPLPSCSLSCPSPRPTTTWSALPSAETGTPSEHLYRKHSDRVYGAILRLAAFDHARAEDLTQEAFIRAWQKLDGFRFESAFGTWVYRLAVNVALMSIRARNADPVSIVDDEHLPDIADIDNPVRAVERDELEKAIAALPPRARAVLVLHDVEGWKHDEIGI